MNRITGKQKIIAMLNALSNKKNFEKLAKMNEKELLANYPLLDMCPLQLGLRKQMVCDDVTLGSCLICWYETLTKEEKEDVCKPDKN